MAGAGPSTAPSHDGAVVFPNARFLVDFDEGLQAVRPAMLELGFSDCDWLRAKCLELGVAVRELDDGALDLDLDLDRQFGMHWLCVPAAVWPRP